GKGARSPKISRPRGPHRRCGTAWRRLALCIGDPGNSSHHRLMLGPIARFLIQDHREIEVLLTATLASDPLDLQTFETFRERLLRHIGMEEKVLLPAARRARHGEPLPVAQQLRADHAALAALLVPTPSLALLAQIRDVLSAHNLLEEGAGGLYDLCDQLAGP